jgi:hypothetical protein
MMTSCACSRIGVAALFAALAAGCASGAPADDGRVRMSVAVSGLTAEQGFCATWKLFQLTGGAWTLIDKHDQAVCAAAGADALTDWATCADGKRFLVEYAITFYRDGAPVGSAVATSGGGASDVCARGVDRDSYVRVQFGQGGGGGGVNPGVEIDRVCSSDKVALEEGVLVSALWLQPDSCTETTPDSFCSIGYGAGLATNRTGVTEDGRLRYIFNTSPEDAAWDVFYLAFAPATPQDQLILTTNAWVQHHSAAGGSYGRETLTGLFGSFRSGDVVGFAQLMSTSDGPEIRVAWDDTAACDAPIALDGHVTTITPPACDGTLRASGLIREGGSAFSLILDCEGEITLVGCDANSAPVCGD